MVFVGIGFCLVAIFIMLYELWFNNHPLRIGYVPSNLNTIKPILTNVTSRYNLTPQQSELFELGCGLAHVLRWYGVQYKWKKNTGIELDLFWFLLAKLTVFFL